MFIEHIQGAIITQFVTTEERVEILARETCNKAKVFKFLKYIQILFGI
jgi:hypothetical protein